MASPPPPAATPDRTGLTAALGAYLIWGAMPLYLLLVRSVPPVEFVAWRVIWTLPLCAAILAFRHQWADLFAALADRRALPRLMLSALLVGTNWLVYIYAIVEGRVFAASLGYYINPLVNVALGTLFLGERLTRLQWGAVALAGVGVALLAAGALTTLWISLTLAFSFGLYGLVRKTVSVGALPGLTIETLLLLLPAAGIAVWFAAATPGGSSFGRTLPLDLAIVAGGAMTAIPLLLFTVAARRMDYSLLGFIQFLAPTIVFVLGLTVFEEPLRPVQLASFACIWGAIALFVADLWRKAHRTG